MNFKIKISPYIVLVLVWAPSPGYCLSNETIFQWVISQMDVDQAISTPAVTFADRDNLQQAFRQGNRKAYLRWESQYGPDKAAEILNEYLTNIVGLFNEEDQTIYVAAFISPCKRQAVLAHEFVHYIQHITRGVIPPGTYNEDLHRLAREMEAYGFESRFVEAYCPEEAIR